MRALRGPGGVLAAALVSAAMVFGVARTQPARPGAVAESTMRRGTYTCKTCGRAECIDPETESVDPFVILAQQTCRNAKSQEWTFPAVASIGGNWEYLMRNHNSNLCAAPVDPAGANGSKVDQIPCAFDPIQEWAAVQPWLGGGVFWKNAATGKCLDLENGDPTIGVEMQVWDCNFNTGNQEWNSI